MSSYPSESTEVTASGTVKSGNGKLMGGTLTADTAAAALVLYDNTAAAGPILRTVRVSAGASKSLDVPPGGLRFGAGLHAVLTGLGAALYLDF